MNVEIRDLETTEADLVANFFNEQWRPDHVFYRNRELLFWQYRDNPYASLFSAGLTFRAAFNGRRVPLGVFGYMPFAFNRFGTKQHGCHLSAWWVHPEQRKGPLAIKLLHSLQQHSPFNACIAGINSATAENIYERMSWVVVRNIPRLLYVVDSKQFQNLLDPVGAMPKQALAAIESARASATSLPIDPRIEISPLLSFKSLADLNWDAFFWREIAPPLMGPAREASYLHWRYGQIPVFSYQSILAKRTEGVAGLLVYRVERVKDREEQVIRLVDIVAEPSVIPSLAGALIRLASSLGVAVIDFFCTYRPYLEQLRACGFVDASDSSGGRYWFPHLFQPLDHSRTRLNCSWWIRDEDLKGLSARSDFCLLKGDYEFDRPN